jgi:hypothetical protein
VQFCHGVGDGGCQGGRTPEGVLVGGELDGVAAPLTVDLRVERGDCPARLHGPHTNGSDRVGTSVYSWAMHNATELFGYVASFFVAISLLMNGLLALRILNLIGALSFVAYGLLLGSVPILITNAFITIVDIYYLIRMFRPDLNGVRYIAVGPDQRVSSTTSFPTTSRTSSISSPDFSTDRGVAVSRRRGARISP